MPARPLTAKDVFLAALEKPDGAERDRFVSDSCGADESLRREVAGLLRGHKETGEFLARPAWVDASVPIGLVEAPGAMVAGRYKLIEKIGEGGMGTVWMAEQREPIKRMVALKVIRAGVDANQLAARFEAERQALAVMDHPNIARILDAGAVSLDATPHSPLSTRPFFVMELVKGVSITAFCDERRLPPRERLELFVPVCEAIQHAHQKGVIHRDIKPGNILVALYDGRPVPKVIDFGVAKAVGDPLTERTLHTHFGAVVGTPQYMSPEQAETNQLDVDTRSDVYSLGVVLYELLAGSPPFDRKSLGQAALLEVLRIIREVDPPLPSSKLSTDDALPGIAAKRATEPAKLTRLVRGELDWIVMRALEKDRERRYGSANALGEDIRRYLAGDAVNACPPSRAYRARKFLARNRGPVFAASLLFLALVAGIVGTTIGMLKARDATAKEREAKEIARGRADKLQNNVEILSSLFRDLDPRGDSKGGKSLRMQLTDRMVKAAEGLDGPAAGEPDDIARMRQNLAMALRSLDRTPEAIALFEKSLAYCEENLAKNDERTLAAMNNLAIAYEADKRHEKAIELYERVVEARTRLLGAADPETLLTQTNLSVALNKAGKYGKSLEMLERILPLQRIKPGPAHRDTLGTMNNLYFCYRALGRMDDAKKILTEAFETKRKAAGAEDPDCITTQHNLAHFLHRNGNLAEALANAEEVHRNGRNVLGADNALTMDALQLTSIIHGEMKQYGKAADALRELVRLHRLKSGAKDENTLYFQIELGQSLLKDKRPTEAETVLRDCLANHLAAAPQSWRNYYVMNVLGEAMAAGPDKAAAEKMMLDGYNGMDARIAILPDASRMQLRRMAIERIIRFYEAEARADEIGKWKAKLPKE